MRTGENASQITAEVHSQQKDLWQNTTVCGFFRDDNVDTNASADTYSRLETALGPQPLGRLLNIRANIKEWYTSMEQIHRIMTALCVMLLTIALTNLFCTIVFEYMEQQHSLAILWSAGISPRGLLKMSVSRCLRELLKAAIVGIFLSVILCYSIYNIFIYVWQRAFHLPWLQLAVVGGLGLCIAGLAFVLEYKIMKRQDFLAAIRKCAD